MTEQEFTDKADAVAKAFGISEAAAYRLAREKKIPAGTYGYLNERTLRFNLEALKRWFASGGASERSRAA